MKIAGCVALVTGSGGGLGRVWVAELLAAGAAKVYAGTRDPAAFGPADPRVTPVALDITDEGSVQKAVQECADVTLLVNNAGVMRHRTFLADGAPEAARAEMEVHYFGTLRACRAFVPLLEASGGGAVVNVLSATARISYPPEATYSASKAAALSLTHGLRAELAARGSGVRVVGVLPGTLGVGMSAGAPVAAELSAEVVRAALAAVEREAGAGGWDAGEDVYPSAEAQAVLAALRADEVALERQMAGALTPGWQQDGKDERE
jgi:NAD(P)-dependent dehydrogenase (short-subunit alcohol dehydrogenase family)